MTTPKLYTTTSGVCYRDIPPLFLLLEVNGKKKKCICISNFSNTPEPAYELGQVVTFDSYELDSTDRTLSDSALPEGLLEYIIEQEKKVSKMTSVLKELPDTFTDEWSSANCSYCQVDLCEEKHDEDCPHEFIASLRESK